MSTIRNANIRGLQSTLLEKDSYSSFNDCITRQSMRIDNPQEQRGLHIHKYIPLRYLLVLLKEKMLILNPVASWEDPFENFFLKQHFVQPGQEAHYVTVENLTKGLYGMSWTLQDETDSLWRIYSTDRLSVRITTTIEELVITVCSEDDKWDIWMNSVQYKTDEEIKAWLGLCKEIKQQYEFIEKMSESFFIKRKAFEAEKEYRLVVNYAKEIRPTICFRCNPENLINSILIDPRVNEYEYDGIKASLMSYGVEERKIAKSNLYYFKPQKVEMEYDLFQDF